MKFEKLLKTKSLVFIIIVITSTLMHLPHFNKDLCSIHVWRQTQTQTGINCFYQEDMNIFNPKINARGNTDGIFRMEFPLMQWLTACLYKIFGNHLIISRIFMFIVGLFSVFGTFKLIKYLFNNDIIAMIGAWAFNFSPSFYYHTINPMPDNLALCCSIWGLVFFFVWYKNQKIRNLIFSGIFLSIAALCKLPFIIYYIVPLVYFIVLLNKKQYNNAKFITNVLCIFSFAILPCLWYLFVISGWTGNPIVSGMIGNEKPLSLILDYYRSVLFSTLPELLLNYGSTIFFLLAFFFLIKNKKYKNTKFILLLSLSLSCLAYYFFEANAIAYIHDYYLFPFYPLLFILVAYGAYNLIVSKHKIFRYFTIALLILLPLFCFLRMKGRWDLESPGFNKDLLTYKEEFRNAVPNDALVVAGNDESGFIFLYYIDKKGWFFYDDNLNQENLQQMIDNGAKYLYTDSEKNIEIKYPQNIENKILEKGSISIYLLKK